MNEQELRDAIGRFTSGGTVGAHVLASGNKKQTLEHLTAAHAARHVWFEPPPPDAEHASRVRSWLRSPRVSGAIGSFASSVRTAVTDPERVKTVLGTALNAGIGHYVYTHDYVDSDIVAHAVQHVEVGLAVTASQARDVLSSLTSKLKSLAVGAHEAIGKSLSAFGRALSSVTGRAPRPQSGVGSRHVVRVSRHQRVAPHPRK